MRWLVLLLMFFGASATAADEAYDYHLKPQKIAADTYVLFGKQQDFSKENGGNIANTAFIVTGAGVVVIDTGPSLRYGRQLRQAITEITSQPVIKVFNTHHHPDHFLGNQAFLQQPLWALPGTIEAMKQDGEAFVDNMYRLLGDWMLETKVTPDNHPVSPGTETIGNHKLEYLAFEGHSKADLVIFDHTTGVLFTGDLVFHNRAPTTPHAEAATWLASLDKLAQIPFKILVPGHGPISTDTVAIDQTREYVLWLDGYLSEAAGRGLDMIEVMSLPIPDRFSDLAVVSAEYRRSVSHWYPRYEARALQQ